MDMMEERIAKIRARARADEEKKRKEEEEKQKRFECAKESIQKLAPRIANLIDLVNACIKNKVVPYKPTKGVTVGSSRNFFEAEGFFHQLGFDRNLDSMREVEELAIINGGACGDIDLYVGRDGVPYGYRAKSFYHNATYTEPRTQDMEKFLRQFDNFEKEFLDFIDNL